MTDATTRPLPVIESKQTTAGNYFVSNYPPFSFWSDDQTEALASALDSPPAPDAPLGAYVHIPFCRKRCHFCYFKVYTDKNAAAIGEYLDAVIAEAKRVGGKAAVAGRPVKYLYFGGGTPSYLSVKQLTQLLDGLREALDFSQLQEFAFECEPGTLNRKKLEALHELGVTRLSLGVENFDEHILKINNRAHDGRAVDRAYDDAREVGFPQINIDLIAGMIDETEANWSRCIDKTIAMAPDSVTIYQMEIPFNTTIYQQMKQRGEVKAPVADWSVKRRWVAEAFARLEEAGYSISSAYTAVRDAATTRFLYRDDLWRGADMVALGVSSFGHIGGVHYQNQKDFEPYIEAVEAGGLPLRRAYQTSERERMIREFILQMKLGRLDLNYFTGKFGADPRDVFADALAELQRSGAATIDGDHLLLDRQALLYVDNLLPAFFLPEHRDARYT